MAANPSSPTPNPSGNDKSTANKSGGKINRQPNKKLKPTHVANQNTPWWIDLSDGVGLIGALVIWAEMYDCHTLFPLIFYFAALLLCYVGICHLFYHLFQKKPLAVKLSLSVWFILAVITSGFVWKNSRPLHSEQPQTLKSLGVVEQEPNVTLETLGVVSKWKPPELPKDCTFVFVRLGGSSFGCPPAILPNGPIPSAALGDFIAFPGESPIEPYIKDNRFYVAVKNLLRTNLETIFMSEDLDYPLPPKWDRNYSSNAFEIVSEDGLPVLQIAYLQPNVIQINGIFFTTTNHGIVAFGSGFSISPFPIDKNNPFFSQRKAWFVYPSKDHIGELAK